MERLQFPTDFKKRWRSLFIELNQIVEMWDPSGGAEVNPKFFWQQCVEKLGIGGTQRCS